MKPNHEMETPRKATLRVPGFVPGSNNPEGFKRPDAVPAPRGPQRGGRLLALLCGLALGTWPFTASAEIPEPDNIIYGAIARNGLPVSAADTDVVVEARRNSDGAVVASYRMGDSTRSGNNFTLRVPLEVFTPVLDPLASLTGTPMTIVASDLGGVIAEVPFTLAGRGQFHQLNLGQLPGADSDGDGLLDDWEILWFGNLLQTGTTDWDGDGATDGYEYLAGTDPKNANSRFRLSIDRTGPTGKEVSFVAQAAAGTGYAGKVRTYTLEWSTSLDVNNWTPLAGYIGVTGNGQTVRYPVPADGPATVFYRAVIQLNNTGSTPPP